VPMRCHRSSVRRALRKQGHARPRAMARDVRNQPAIANTLFVVAPRDCFGTCDESAAVNLPVPVPVNLTVAVAVYRLITSRAPADGPSSNWMGVATRCAWDAWGRTCAVAALPRAHQLRCAARWPDRTTSAARYVSAAGTAAQLHSRMPMLIRPI
jgi:hypothetical protein